MSSRKEIYNYVRVCVYAYVHKWSVVIQDTTGKDCHKVIT